MGNKGYIQLVLTGIDRYEATGQIDGELEHVAVITQEMHDRLPMPFRKEVGSRIARGLTVKVWIGVKGKDDIDTMVSAQPEALTELAVRLVCDQYSRYRAALQKRADEILAELPKAIVRAIEMKRPLETGLPMRMRDRITGHPLPDLDPAKWEEALQLIDGQWKDAESLVAEALGQGGER